MKISVALCTYNGAVFIARQLHSIISQDLPVNEIIVCDDGSTDETVNIVKGFQEHHPGLLTIFQNKPNLGARKNFAQAIAHCTGDIIFLSDQDDEWVPAKTQKIVSVFQNNPGALAVFTDGVIIDDCGKETGKKLWSTFGFTQQMQHTWASSGAFADLVTNRNPVTGATMAIHRNLMKHVPHFDMPLSYWHDGWLALHAADLDGVFFSEEPLTRYRVHDGQQLGIGNGTQVAAAAGRLTDLLDNKKISRGQWIQLFLAQDAPFFNHLEKMPAFAQRLRAQHDILQYRETLKGNFWHRVTHTKVSVLKKYNIFYRAGHFRYWIKDTIFPGRS